MIIILDYCVPEKLSDFFGVDITQDLEEFYAEPEGILSESYPQPEGILSESYPQPEGIFFEPYS